MKERVKVQRGWKNPKGAIVEGQHIFYNFIKPHQMLDGKTPVEKIGLKIIGKNKIKMLEFSSHDE